MKGWREAARKDARWGERTEDARGRGLGGAGGGGGADERWEGLVGLGDVSGRGK